MKYRFSSHTLTPLFLLLLSSCPLSVGAVDSMESVKPKGLEDVEPEAKRPDAGKEQGAAAEETLIDSLRGVVIGWGEDQVLAIQERGLDGFQAADLSAPDTRAAEKIVAAHLRKPLSLESLSRLQAKLEAHFSRGDRPMTLTVTPDQEITGGVIGLVLKERVAGEVRIHPEPAFGGEFIRKNIRVTPGSELRERTLTEDLAWINENPFRRVDLTYVEGEGHGVSDLELSVTDKKPFQGYFGYDNFANERVGNDRIFAGVRHGNLWDLDHRLMFQYTASPAFDRLRAESLVYEWPLPWRHIMEVTLTDSFADADLGGAYALNGIFREAGLKYWIPLPPTGGNLHRIYFGAGYQENDYEIEGRGGAVERFVRFFVLQSGYEGKYVDSLGYTRVNAGLRFSPGDGAFGIDDREYRSISAGADSRFVTGQLNIDRTWWMPWNSTLATRMEGQWSDSRLLSSEQFGASGAYDVRGYDESDAFADNALKFTLEWTSAPFRLMPANMGRDRTRFLFFWDYAHLYNKGGATSQLSGAGVGVRMNWADHLQVRADVGLPLLDEAYDDGPRLHLGVTVVF